VTLDRIEANLRAVLEHTDDDDARYHVREALQQLKILEELEVEDR
jgi:hypothetical protein